MPSENEKLSETYLIAKISECADREMEYLINYGEPGEAMLSCHKLVENGLLRSEESAAIVAQCLRRWTDACVERYQMAQRNSPPALKWLSIIDYIVHISLKACENGEHVSAAMLEYLAQPMLRVLSLPMPPDNTRDIAEMLNIGVFVGNTRSVREGMFNKLSLLLRGLATRLALCGDYSTQQCLLESLAHLTPLPRAARVDAARAVLSDEHYSDEAVLLYVYCDFKNFLMDSREFLMLVNAHSELVTHLVCSAAILDGVALVGPAGNPDDTIYCELNRGSARLTFEYLHESTEPSLRLLTAAASDVIGVHFRKENSHLMIEVCARGMAISPSDAPRDHVSVLCLYPLSNVLSTHTAMKIIFGDKYKCETSLEEVAGYPKPPSYYQGRALSDEDGNEDKLARASQTSSIKKRTCSVAWRQSMVESSISGASACELPQALRNFHGYEADKNNAHYLQWRQLFRNYAPMEEHVDEISFKVGIISTNSRFKNNVDIINDSHELEVISEENNVEHTYGDCPGGLTTEKFTEDNNKLTDRELVNDLYQDALSGDVPRSQQLLKSQGDSDDEPLIKKINKMSKCDKEKNYNEISTNKVDDVYNHYIDKDQCVNVDKNDKSSSAENSIQKENNIVNTHKLKRTLQNNDKETTYRSKIAKEKANKFKNPLPGKKHLRREQVNCNVLESAVASEANEMNVNDLDIQNKQSKSVESAAEGSGNSEAIPDTPNMKSDFKFNNISVKKTPSTTINELSKREKNETSHNETLIKKKTMKVNKKDTKIKNKIFTHRTPNRTSNSSSVGYSDNSKNLQVLNEIGNCVSPIRQHRKRLLYSPNADFIVQNSQEDETEKSVTGKKIPYVVLEKLPKNKMARKNEQKTNLDVIFDTLKTTNINEQNVGININNDKDIAVYNYSDSEEDFREQSKIRRKSSDISVCSKNVSKTKVSSKRKRGPAKKKKISETDESSIISVPDRMLVDERMRKQSSSALDVLNISMEIDTNSKHNAETEEIVPKLMGNIDMEPIPEETQSKSTDAGYQSLKPVTDKPRDKSVKIKSRVKKTEAKKASKFILTGERLPTPPPLIIEKEKKRDDSLNNINAIVHTYLHNMETPGENCMTQQIMKQLALPVVQVLSNDLIENSSGSKEVIEQMENCDKTGEVINKDGNRSIVMIQSSPELENYLELKSIPTDASSPINAHGDEDEEPPTLRSLDADVHGRELETEKLNSKDKSFIRKLNSSTKSSSERTLNSVNTVNTSRRSHRSKKRKKFVSPTFSTPRKSNSPSKLYFDIENLVQLSPIQLQDPISIGEQSTSFTPPVTRRAVRHLRRVNEASNEGTQISVDLSTKSDKTSPKQSIASLQPSTTVHSDMPLSLAKTKNQSINDISTIQWPGIDSLVREESGDLPADSASTMVDVCEVLLENMETGIRESVHHMKTQIVTVVASTLNRLDELSRWSDGAHAALREERLRLLEQEEEVLKKRRETGQQIMDDMKSGLLSLMREQSQRASLRVHMLREDVHGMLRRYRASTGSDLRLRRG